MLNGAGATFPYPLYSKWFDEYHKLKPDIAFNYQSIGSGGGIRQLLDETVDFGASDAPMKDDQLKKAKRPILHIPATMGAVVIAYNLPAIHQPLQLTGALVADLFLGKIKKWSDPRIIELNRGALEPLLSAGDPDVLIVHRSDGSGTTAIFSEYLSKVSPAWKSGPGQGTALRWPAGIGGKGNEGVSSFIKQIPGAVGYVELVFAKTLRLPYAWLENARKEMIDASPQAVTAAAEGMISTIPDDFRASMTQVDAKGAYPISSFTYLLVYTEPEDRKRLAMKEFLKWALTDGQKLAVPLNYAALPPALAARVLKKLEAPK